MDKWKNAWKALRINKRASERSNERMKEQTKERMSKLKYIWKNARNQRVRENMNEWKKE